MVKMAVLSAWAELQVASSEQKYLTDVVKPHIAGLTPLWLTSLQEFARLRFEPDISSTMGINADDALDVVYAAMNRQTLLKVISSTNVDLTLIRYSSTRIHGSRWSTQSLASSIKTVPLSLLL